MTVYDVVVWRHFTGKTVAFKTYPTREAAEADKARFLRTVQVGRNDRLEATVEPRGVRP